MKVIKIFESDSFSKDQKNSITTFLTEVKSIYPETIFPARYSVEQDSHILMQEDAVRVMFEAQGNKALPIVCVNEVMVSFGVLPQVSQIRKYIDNATDSDDIDDCCGGGCCST